MEVTLKCAGEGGNFHSVSWTMEMVVWRHLHGKSLYCGMELEQGENKGHSHYTAEKWIYIYIYMYENRGGAL